MFQAVWWAGRGDGVREDMVVHPTVKVASQ